jgi:hypothetical protein
MRCPCKTSDVACAVEQAHRWSYVLRKAAVVLADVVDFDIVFTVIVGYHLEYLAGRVVVYSVDQHGKATS